MSTFDSTKLPLPQVLGDITAGKIQLPDFQRGWVWDDEHVKSLLISIARSFPVGAVMMLDAGGDIRFQVRPIENVDFPGDPPEPERLILDGQQRLTSLTQVLSLHKPVQTLNEKRAEIQRYYYIDIFRALADDQLTDAFISVPEDRKIKENFNRDIKMDLSTRALELEHFHFPCSQILNSDEWEHALSKHDPNLFAGDFMSFRKKVLSAFRNYQLPVITLGKATSKEAVCLIFEKVNTGGVSLSVFELVTATFAADGFNLRDDWLGNKSREKEGRRERLSSDPLLAGVESTDFLQAISILHTHERRQEDIEAGKKGKMISAVSAKRTSILSLSPDVYCKWAPKVEQGFKRAAQFMRKQCFFSAREIPYRTQLVPLAAVLSELGDRWREPRIHDRLSQWFWCGVLGELYGRTVETRIANDFEEILPWATSFDVNGTPRPRTISEAAFQESRLDTLRTRLSAAYKGLNVLVLREGAKDFFWKDTIQNLHNEGMALNIHHIFPRAWCKDKGIKSSIYDSVVNKTPISSKANHMIGRKAPSEYLSALESNPQVGLSEDEMNDILATHRIPPEHLRTDNFEEFYTGRKEALLALIEKAMGKTAQRDQSQNARSVNALW